MQIYIFTLCIITRKQLKLIHKTKNLQNFTNYQPTQIEI